MHKEKNTKAKDQQPGKTHQPAGKEQAHRPVAEPVNREQTGETPEEAAAAEQQRKEALTERD